MSSRPTLPPPGSPVLRIPGVNHHFGAGDTRTQVLFDNTLEVMPGELVIMSGPSGSGQDDAPHAHRRAAHASGGRDRGLGRRSRRLPQAPRHAGAGTGQRPPADRLHLPAAQPLRLAHRDAERPHGAAAEGARRRPRRRRPRPPAVPAPRRPRPSTASRRSRGSTTSPRRSPAGSGSASRSPARSSTGRSSCWPTSRPPRSTPTSGLAVVTLLQNLARERPEARTRSSSCGPPEEAGENGRLADVAGRAAEEDSRPRPARRA